jgi:hypothetical protein
MNLPAPLSPATARPGGSPVSAPDEAKESTSPTTSSFGFVLDRASNPLRERVLARLRSSSRGSVGGNIGEDSLKEPQPIKEEQRKVDEVAQGSLAGAGAVLPAAAQGAACGPSQGWQTLRSTPATADNMPGTSTPTALIAEPASVTPPAFESPCADGKAGAKVPVELVPVASAEASIGETPNANSSIQTSKESASLGQLTAEDSLSAIKEDLVELVLDESDVASRVPIELKEAMQSGSANVDDSTSASRNELVVEGANSRGIVPAKVEEPMKNIAEQDEVATSAKQILPGAQTPQLRSVRAETRREARRNLAESVFAEAFVGVACAKDALSSIGRELPLASDLLTGRPSPVEQMSKVISREVQIFKRTADETMEVVLTPDHNTQISLRLQWREGKVEVLAHCNQGNYQVLNAQWSQLQTALGQQGVRLAQLTQPSHTGFTEVFSSAGFAQSQNGGRQQPEPKAALDELPSAAVIQPAGKSHARVAAREVHLLESWA